jgi:hypothetical protein
LSVDISIHFSSFLYRIRDPQPLEKVTAGKVPQQPVDVTSQRISPWFFTHFQTMAQERSSSIFCLTLRNLSLPPVAMASERAKIREELRAKIARGGFFVLVTL